MGWVRISTPTKGWSALGIGAGVGFLLAVAPAVADGPVFLRGDANGDGKISLSDCMMIEMWGRGELGGYWENWEEMLKNLQATHCLDAADANDDGYVDTQDTIAIIGALFHIVMPPWSSAMPYSPPGVDQTPDDALACMVTDVAPPRETDDIVRIGDFEAAPGQEVQIPIFLSNSKEVQAFQMVVSYDPQIVLPPDRIDCQHCEQNLVFEGTYFQHLFDDIEYATASNSLMFKTVNWYPEQGFFTVGVITYLGDLNHFIAPGDNSLLIKVRAKVSSNALPGSVVSLDLTNGPDGLGVLPPFNLQNELTYLGEARLVSVLPHRIAGRIGIVDDLTVFVRGDANSDGLVDISDPISVLGYLYTGGPAPACLDAADADDNGKIEITDAVVMLQSLFLGTSSISAPYPSPGKDMTADDLSCDL